MPSNSAVFLDRDGTINKDPGYLGNPDLVKLLPGVAEGIKFLKSNYKFKIIVVSNQSGIDRGLISRADVDKVNLKINDLLMEQNAAIDVFYYCPFHPELSGDEKANCRKPLPTMIFKAAEENDVDLTRSYLIGDRATDILCGLNAKVKSILLKSDLLSDEINSLKNEGKSPNFVANDFLDAVEFIKQDI